MSTSCQKLAARYAAETGIAIPPSTADSKIRSEWLLTQTWGCIPPGQTLADFSSDPTFCNQNNNPAAPDPGTYPNTALTRPPTFNYLKEDGFLHWVNQRGLQCVNRIVGNFYGFNPQTGNANRPGPSVTPPNSQCWGACFQVSSNSEMCFECVNQVLLSDPSLCPQLNPNNPDDETLIRDSVNCHECIGTQSTFIPSSPDTSTVPNEDAMVNNMWKCITGIVKPALTTADIIIIALICVFVAVIALVLGLYYGYFHPKVLKKEKERRAILAAGFSPDEL